MRLLLSFFPVYLLLMFSSCYKIARETYFVREDAKTWFNYKKGTYWIMKDSATGLSDSFATWATGRGFSEDGIDHHQYEYYSCHIDQYHDTTIVGTAQIRMGCTRKVSLGSLYFNAIADSGTFIQPMQYYGFMNFPFTPSPDLGSSGQKVEIDYVGAFPVEGVLYDSVYHLMYYHPDSTGYEHFYINRTSGFLKIAQRYGWLKRTLTLQRVNVVK
jgi:hypothetical protein